MSCVPRSHSCVVADGLQSSCSHAGLCTASVGGRGSEEGKPQQRTTGCHRNSAGMCATTRRNSMSLRQDGLCVSGAEDNQCR